MLKLKLQIKKKKKGLNWKFPVLVKYMVKQKCGLCL